MKITEEKEQMIWKFYSDAKVKIIFHFILGFFIFVKKEFIFSITKQTQLLEMSLNSKWVD